MIASMKKISLCGISDDRTKTLEYLQKIGCVELISPGNTADFETIDISEKKAADERQMVLAQKSLSIIEDISPENKSIFSTSRLNTGRKIHIDDSERELMQKTIADIISVKDELDANHALISRLKSEIPYYETWLNLDVSMAESCGISYDGYQFCILNELSYSELDDMLGEYKNKTYYEIVYSSKNLSNVYFIILKDYETEVISILRENGFVEANENFRSYTAVEQINNIKGEICEINTKNEELEKKLVAYSDMRNSIKLFFDILSLERERYESLAKVGLTNDTFYIEGYVPQENCDKLKSGLFDKFLCAVEINDIPDDEEAPVLFKNNAFVSPVEDITRDYSMPSRSDIDPNAVMSIFYYIFFGMMFSDAGYGLLMVLVCGFMGFIAGTSGNKRQFMRMFFYCGVSTMFWGFMFGSFFGDAIKSLKPIWINPVEEPLLLLIFSVALGLVQIVTGLVCKLYVDYRAGDKKAAVYDSGSWIMVLLGAAILCGGAFLKFSALTIIGVSLAVLGAIIVVLMRGRDKTNIFSRIFSGILGLYDVTSYVSDLLSYSRLMALGLATGVIAQVVNVMCSLASGGVVGTVLTAIIFILGHALNFAINILGAYVHTNRLQYVEFYSKFYEGGGKNFKPLSMNTKYYDFMEDD